MWTIKIKEDINELLFVKDLKLVYPLIFVSFKNKKLIMNIKGEVPKILMYKVFELIEEHKIDFDTLTDTKKIDRLAKVLGLK